MTRWFVASFLLAASMQTPPVRTPPQTPPVRTPPTQTPPTSPQTPQTPPAGGGAAQPAPPSPPPSPYAFPSGAGMYVFYVKPDKATDFEGVLRRIADVLDKSQDPARKSQAASWRIYKSVEPTTAERIYVFTFDPASTSVDYDVVKLLSEAAPGDAQSLFDRMKDDVVKVERMGLAKIR